MKKTNKIILICVILVILAIVGLLIWIFASKLNSANNKINELEKNIKNGVVEQNNTKENIVNNETNTTDNTTANNTVNNTASKNVQQNTKITLKNTEKEVKRLTVGGANYVCKVQEPKLSGLEPSIATKIENQLTKYFDDVWKNISKDQSDDDITDILKGYDENGDKREIGFEQSYKIEYYNDKIITFKYEFAGSLGGVSWGSSSGMSFYVSNGELVVIKDIVTDKEEYKKACSKSVYEQLKKDERFDGLVQNYQEIVDDTINKIDGYVLKDGIMCVEIPKYEIASGAAGEFKFVVKYDDISKYIDINKIK